MKSARAVCVSCVSALLMLPFPRDSETGYALSVGRGQPVAAAAAVAASDGIALPTVFEQAAAGVAGVGAGAGPDAPQLCVVREGEVAKMGGCEEQTKLTLQVRSRASLLGARFQAM